MRISRIANIALVGLAPIVLAADSCFPTDNASTTPTLQCPAGQRALNATVCGWNPDTIVIGPALQSFTSTPLNGGAPQTNFFPGCYVFTPDPTSVHTSQPIYWTNKSTASVTVFQTSGTPLVTVAPNATEGGVFYTSAGTVQFTISGCQSGSAKFGTIIITVT